MEISLHIKLTFKGNAAMKLLIADDNKNMRAAIRKIIKRSFKNIEIFECDNGDDAMKKYHIILPDWVIMDVRLTGLNGLKATQMITNADPNAKVIILTQYDDPEYKDAAKKAGAFRYVLKDNLLDIVKIIRFKNNSGEFP